MGEKGIVGPPGLLGPKGDKGDIGEKGIQGIMGDKGDMGDMGPKGAIGEIGQKGDMGPFGAKGAKGEAAHMSVSVYVCIPLLPFIFLSFSPCINYYVTSIFDSGHSNIVYNMWCLSHTLLQC